MARARAARSPRRRKVMELNVTEQLSRVRIWDGSTPWLITGYDAIRSLFTDGRASVDDRKPGYPHWNEGMLSRCTSGRVRCSPPMPRSTPDSAGCCRGRSPSSGSRRSGLRCSGSPTSTSTRYWPARNRPTSSKGWRSRFPSLVISEMLGVPYEDAEFFQEQANRGMSRYATRRGRGRRRGRAGQVLEEPDCSPRWTTPARIWCPIWPSG